MIDEYPAARLSELLPFPQSTNGLGWEAEGQLIGERRLEAGVSA